MKILIISDTHGHNDIVDELYRIHSNMDLYLHAGDSCTEEYALYPFQTVKGNCDFDYNMNERFVVKTPYGSLLIKHVPNLTLDELKRQNIKIYVFGHLHERHFYQEDGVYFVSPGSTCREKDRFKEGYMILDISDTGVQAEFFDL